MLKDKTALVTGSTSGIGLAIAEALAGAGAKVMLNGLGDAAEIESTRARVEAESGSKVAFSGANMLNPAEIEKLVSGTVETFGSLDILVNNAGIQHTAPIEEFPPEKWNAIIGINLSSAFHTMHHAVPHMRRAGWGRIVNTASVHGLVASVEKAAYVAAKHGLVGMTKVVALETAGSGITANCFCPGWVHTELIQRQIEDRAAAEGTSVEEGARNLLEEKQPSLQFVTTGQLAAYVLFLCSPAGDQITGTALPLDGGWTAR